MWSHRRSYPNGGVDRRDGFHKQLDQPEHGSVGYYQQDFQKRKGPYIGIRNLGVIARTLTF